MFERYGRCHCEALGDKIIFFTVFDVTQMLVISFPVRIIFGKFVYNVVFRHACLVGGGEEVVRMEWVVDEKIVLTRYISTFSIIK